MDMTCSEAVVPGEALPAAVSCEGKAAGTTRHASGAIALGSGSFDFVAVPISTTFSAVSVYISFAPRNSRSRIKANGRRFGKLNPIALRCG
ncbi:hypothetical protein GCM10009853_068290 [Glycomyces scopariae]